MLRVQLEDIALDVDAGRCLAVAGPSGAGKTTLLRMIGGLAPARGTITCADRTWLDSEHGTNVPPEARRVGFVFQDYALFPHMSALANVEFGAGAGDGAAELLERLGIDAATAERKPPSLSGGERQRVALARALANEPRLLLADEPTGALDTATGEQIVELIKSVRAQRGTTIVLVTNDPEVAAAADRILRIRDGRIAAATSTPV